MKTIIIALSLVSGTCFAEATWDLRYTVGSETVHVELSHDVQKVPMPGTGWVCATEKEVIKGESHMKGVLCKKGETISGIRLFCDGEHWKHNSGTLVLGYGKGGAEVATLGFACLND